jgi:hypothetical protein
VTKAASAEAEGEMVETERRRLSLDDYRLVLRSGLQRVLERTVQMAMVMVM